jgi:hypothetical protein
MWIKDKVNDCYKMSHSHLITIEKVNRHYILYFRDKMIKSFPKGDIYVPGHVPTINGEVKLYKTFARAKQGAQAIYNKCGYVQKFEIHTVEIRSNDKKEIVTVRGLP